MKSKIITFASDDGGSGRSTAVSIIAGMIAEENLRVLVVDNEAFGHTGMRLGLNPEKVKKRIAKILINQNFKVQNLLLKTEYSNIKYLSVSISDLVDVMVTLHKQIVTATMLKELLSLLPNSFDYILIDTPPRTHSLNFNHIIPAHRVIIPVYPDHKANMAIEYTLKSIGKAKMTYDLPTQKVEILPIRVSNKYNFSRRKLEELKTEYAIYFMPNNIKLTESTIISQAAFKGLSLIKNYPRHLVTREYKKLVNYILSS